MYAIMDKAKADNFSWVDWMINEREKLGMSQADLANKSGLTRTTISDYEKRQRSNPDIKALVKISVALEHHPLRLPREAGIVPPEINIDEFTEQIIHETQDLNKREKEEVLAYIRMRKNLRRKE